MTRFLWHLFPSLIAVPLLLHGPDASPDNVSAVRAVPAGAYISDIFVRPSVRNKELGVDIEVSGRPSPGPAEVTARLLDEAGNEEKQFTAQAALIDSPGGRQTVSVAFAWAHPRRWDLHNPNLYTLDLSIKGTGLADETRRTFGFREFWVQGKRFFLNGTPIRLRPASGRDINTLKAAGFNMTVNRPGGSDAPDTPQAEEAWFEKADRAGWLTTGSLANMTKYIVDSRDNLHWNDTNRQAWLRRIEAEMRRMRNHPSIVLWTHTPDFFGHPQDQNPRLVGRTDLQRRAGATGAYAAGLEGCSLIKKLDPTRPVTAYAGADVGDVYTVHHNLNWIPLQEQEDWMTEWAKSGDMPYMGVEVGTPIAGSFFRGRTNYDAAVATEPLVTEYCAIYMGHEAYLEETPEYRANYAGRFADRQRYDFNPDRDLAPILALPSFQKVETLFTKNTWRSWRTTGVTGGMIPGRTKRGEGSDFTADAGDESEKALREANQPTLAWITGPFDAPTAKTHSYHVDENVEKQIALLNDTRIPQPFRCTWKAVMNGKAIASGTARGTLQPAETRFAPLRFATPFFSSGRAGCEISLTAHIGEAVHEDRFHIRIFARRSRRDHPPSLPFFGSPGKTGDILPVVDYVPRRWKGERTVPLVIIGQNALSSGARLSGALEAYVRGGGRILLFAQTPGWIEKTLGLRVSAYQSRRVFPVSEAHPLMRGLDASDLRDWRGSSTVLAAKPMVSGDLPVAGWHWGNRGVVSSISIEKPHTSSWRPILEDEFDLAYSPLMELDYGRGRVIWCSLDLEDHAITDAAAERVFERVLDYSLHAPLTPKAARVAYIGNKSGSDLLDSLGVIYSGAPDGALLTGPSAPQVVIVGPGASTDRMALAGYVHGGGKLLFLAHSNPELPGEQIQTARIRNSPTEVPAWPECRGLSVSDLHLRAEFDAPMLKSLPDLEAGGQHGAAQIGVEGLLGRIRLGKGTALFCQIDPRSLDADARTYLRLTRWRETRTLCQLLANMGVSFRQDALLFDPSRRTAQTPGFYHPDYRTDFDLGDNPYRYYRW